MDVQVEVFRDGEKHAGPMTENEAFKWLHDHQGQSVSWAIAHEGWEIRPYRYAPETREVDIRDALATLDDIEDPGDIGDAEWLAIGVLQDVARNLLNKGLAPAS